MANVRKREYMQRSLGCHVDGAALPMVDASHVESVICGAAKRFAADPPPLDRAVLRRFRSFVRVFIRANWKPLSPGELLDFESWLAGTHYSEADKQKFRQLYQDNPKLRKRHLRCQMFGKRETQTEFKHARCINSRSDVFKAWTGRWFASIEKKFFGAYDVEEATRSVMPSAATPSAKWVVKHVPVHLRPSYISSRLDGKFRVYYASDYSSFESLFSPDFMRACELQFYAYMWQGLPGGNDITDLVIRALSQTQVCAGRGCRVRVPGCRMSGEMCTSLGNSFTNLALMAFVCHEHGVKWDGVVEGDDGLFGVEDDVVSAADFEKLGFRIKLERKTDVATAGFCSFFFDRDVRENVVDPGELLAKFGWIHSPLKNAGPAIMKSLLRGKAFSLKAELGAAPIAGALVRYVDRTVGEGKILFEGKGGRMDYWEQSKTRNVGGLRPVAMATRLVVEHLWKVSVADQFAIEEYLDSLTELVPLKNPVIDRLMKPQWVHYWDRYVADFKTDVEDLF